MKSYFTIAAIFILLTSCTSIKIQEVVGKYKTQSVYTYHELILNSDGSFVYYICEESPCDTLNGKWTIKKDELDIILIQKDLPYYEADSTGNNSEITLEALDSRSKTLLNVSYRAFYKQTLICSDLASDTSKTVINGNIDSLYLTMLGYKSVGIKVNPNMKSLIVFLPEENVRQFDNLWKIGKNKVYTQDGFTLWRE